MKRRNPTDYPQWRNLDDAPFPPTPGWLTYGILAVTSLLTALLGYIAFFW